MISKIIWLNLLLITITVGFTTTTYVLYTVSSIILVLYAGMLYALGNEFNEHKTKGKLVPWEYHVLVPTDFSISKLHVICSSAIHIVLVFTQLGSIYLCITILLQCIIRLIAFKHLKRNTSHV